jgi:hypothetical protein
METNDNKAFVRRFYAEADAGNHLDRHPWTPRD